ncbi:site-specific integrase [Sneathiella glossodoripedis]|uniref:site-specific integrase n=1 Tax=Sneathiella glossodoripedis TaxID=418853 RepID=UPI00131EDA4F|nr:site-specific integrase [Sneathiella glossodoripedis]
MSNDEFERVDLKPILKKCLEEFLEVDADHHREAPPRKPLYGGRRHNIDQTVQDVDIETLSLLRGDYRDALRDRNTRLVEKQALALMERHNIPIEQQTEFSLGLLKVLLEYSSIAVQRVESFGDVPWLPKNSLEMETGGEPESSEGNGPLLSTLLPDYFDHQLTETGWSQQTLKQNTATIERFIELVGDKPIQSYQREHLGEFYTVALKVPAKWGQVPAWREMKWKDLVEATKGDDTIPRLTKRTLERHFHALGGLFKHFKQLGKYVGENPASGFTFPSGKNKSVTLGFDRQEWKGEKIVKLFGSPLWQGCKTENKRYLKGELVIKDEKFWLPLLGLYHGNRLEEFAQLTRNDLKLENDIPYFDIQDVLEGNHLKNKQSARRVPVHPTLIDWGIIQYIENVAPNPADRIFPNLRRAGPDQKFGVNFSKWFTRYRQKIGAYERGVDYQSFRHGVVTKLHDAGVASVVVNQLVGHEGQGTGEKVYLKGLSIEKLHEGISRVSWPEVEKLFVKVQKC